MLPETHLDDLRFQELVSEARTRIVHHSPDWTEHNVSDPGITLIELFAWLTEILSYRINRIPDRLRLSLLGLVGVRPAAPRQAEADVRFLLGAAGGAVIPAQTEVASPRTVEGDPVVFQTVAPLTIPGHTLAACAIVRGGHTAKVAVTDGVGELTDEAGAPFGDPPQPDEALLLGFDRPVAGLVLAVTVAGEPADGDEIDPEEPPLVWEASGDGGGWHEAEVISDETGGFLRSGSGTIYVDMPVRSAAARVNGVELHWLRCRTSARGSGVAAHYTHSPRVTTVAAAVVGATARAIHAATIREERIGVSDGLPGAEHRLQYQPVLELRDGETLEVREGRDTQWVAWRRVDTLAQSTPADRHFHLDLTRGEIRFGPAIRQPDGGWRRYGAAPPAGAELRFSQYRHGGGRVGNVSARTLTLLPSPVPGVAAVSNPRPAVGGLDPESVANACERARLEISSCTRAVTAADFEGFTVAASSQVARAICVAPEDDGPIRVHILPRVAAADRRLEMAELTPSAEVMTAVAAALDQHRLIGTSIRLLPVRLRAVSVIADVRASPLADLDRVRVDVEHALYVYLNPLIGGLPSGPGLGWPRGRTLNQGELFGVVYGIPGVEVVNILRMYETDILSGQQAPQPIDSHLALAADELIASGRHIVKVTHRE